MTICKTRAVRRRYSRIPAVAKHMADASLLKFIFDVEHNLIDVLFKSVFSHCEVEQKSNQYTTALLWRGESKEERDAGEYGMITQ
jgi:hypothetical protein